MNQRPPPPLRRVVLQAELGYLLLVALAAALGIGWAIQAQTAARETARLAELTQAAADLRADVYLQLRAATRSELTSQPDALAQYAHLARDIAGQFEALGRVAIGSSEQVAVDYLAQTYATLDADMRRISSTPFDAGQPTPMRLLDPPYERWMLDEFESAQRVLSAVLGREREALVDAAERRNQRGTAIIVLPLVGAILLWLAMRRRFSRRFVEPMRALAARAARLSAGDYEAASPGPQSVAEVRELEAALERTAAEVRAGREQLAVTERDAALGTLVPVVAHNVRNPLASIRAIAQLLGPEAPPDEVAESRDDIIESVDRLERWTSALLRYLHPDRAPHSSQPLAPLMTAAVDSLAGRFASEDVVRALELPPAEVIVSADGPLVEQALAGLVANALDAAPRGSTITVHALVGESTVNVCVDDAGPGIGRLFSASSGGAAVGGSASLAPGPSTKQLGTGLGLPFAANVAQTHGGELEVAPRDDGGTRATMTLPLSVLPPDPADAEDTR